jgi:hypothetical protein
MKHSQIIMQITNKFNELMIYMWLIDIDLLNLFHISQGFLSLQVINLKHYHELVPQVRT